jgi:hypothetical protein
MDIKPAVDSGIKPEFPTEPPAEVKAMTFTLPSPELFGKESSDSTITVDKVEVKEIPAEVKKVEETPKKEDKVEVKEIKPKEESKKVEPKKEESKKVESVLKAPKEEVVIDKKGEKHEEAPKHEIKPITPIRDTKGDDFDYTKYAPQEVVNMKNMSRQSREAYSKLLDENKQLASLKDATYLQHEQGYTLSPEFKQLQEKQYYAQTEAQYWEQALLNIKAGKPFRDIFGFDKNGNPQLSNEIQPTDRDEIRVTNNLSACSIAATQLAGQLSVYPHQFKGRIQQDLRAIDAERHARFAWVQDPKLLEYAVNIEGQGDKKLKDIKHEFKSIFPSYLQNSPATEVASDLFVAMIIQGAELREARNGKQVADIKFDEARRAEPSSNNSPTEPKVTEINGKKIPSSFSMEGMPGR